MVASSVVAFGLGIGGERPPLRSLDHLFVACCSGSWYSYGNPCLHLPGPACVSSMCVQNWEVLSLGTALFSQANDLRNLGYLQLI